MGVVFRGLFSSGARDGGDNSGERLPRWEPGERTIVIVLLPLRRILSRVESGPGVLSETATWDVRRPFFSNYLRAGERIIKEVVIREVPVRRPWEIPSVL